LIDAIACPINHCYLDSQKATFPSGFFYANERFIHEYKKINETLTAMHAMYYRRADSHDAALTLRFAFHKKGGTIHV
jgi:hypothetical protein